MPVSLMTCLVHTIVTPLVMLVIILRLRATRTTFTPCLCRRLRSRLTTRVRIAMLSVAAGLLVTRIPGLRSTVTVTTTCRCTLLENRRGQLPICLPVFGTCIRLTRLIVPVTFLPPDTLWRIRNTLVTRLLIAKIGPKVDSELRKTTVTLVLWTPRCLDLGTASRLPLPHRTCLLATKFGGTLRTFTTARVAIDPFELSLFSMVNALLVLRAQSILPTVLVILLWAWNLMHRLLMLSRRLSTILLEPWT